MWLAASDEVAGVTGQFVGERHVPTNEFRGVEPEERLWAGCELLLFPRR